MHGNMTFVSLGETYQLAMNISELGWEVSVGSLKVFSLYKL
jgi:hypothetical protein